LLAGAPAAIAAGLPAVATGGAKGVTAGSATLTGTVNPEGQATTYRFEYGTTTTYTAQTSSVSAGSGTKNVKVSAAVASLSPNTTYHYRLVATNASGPAMGADHTFKTANVAPGATGPVVATGGTKAVTAGAATVTGTVNPGGKATTYYFQYGTTPSYTAKTSSVSAGSGTKNVSVSAVVGSLSANTTYHYRLVATNASGTTMGADHAFKTAKPSAGVTIAASPNPIGFGLATTISGSVLGPGAVHSAVTLQRAASAGGPFVNVATTTAAAKGAYSFAGVAPSSNTYYRVVANGASSARVLVKVRFRISLNVSNHHPRRGHLVRFFGRAAPRHNGLLVLIQRLGSDGRWHTIGRPHLRRTTGNASVYSVKLHVRRSGQYRAVVGPDARHARGFSGTTRIRVHS
jgi:phosphodiesterase/alkaline phosphatase D-like protein